MRSRVLRAALSNKSRWALVLSLSIAAVAGCSEHSALPKSLTDNVHNTLPIPVMEKTVGTSFSISQAPEILVIGGRTEGVGDNALHVAELVLVNPLAVPILYHGYRVDSWQTKPPAGEIHPLYSQQIKTTDEPTWHEGFMGWCGTGADTMVVPPKHAGRFIARINLPVVAARVGFVCSWQDRPGEQEHKMTVTSDDVIGSSGHRTRTE